jgi:hypothetical protein
MQALFAMITLKGVEVLPKAFAVQCFRPLSFGYIQTLGLEFNKVAEYADGFPDFPKKVL